MANREQLARLKSGKEIWNEWLKVHRQEQIDLSGADLSGADLSGVWLSMLDLSTVNLSGANLDTIPIFV